MRQFGIVATPGLSLRAGPSMDEDIRDELAHGDRVLVLGRHERWLEVEVVATANGNTIQVGETGWVWADHIALEPAPRPDIPLPPPVPSPKPVPHRHYKVEIVAAVVAIAAIALLASCLG